MYVDETMSPGQFHHPRFIGERGGRQQQCLVGENSVRSTGWSTGSLGEDLVGRIAKPNFAGACEMRSTRTDTRRNRPSGPRERAGDERVSRGRRASSPGVEKKSRFALFLAKKAYYGGSWGSNPGKLKKILILVPTRVLFLARFRFERRNPRLERRSLSLGCWMSRGLVADRRSYLQPTGEFEWTK